MEDAENNVELIDTKPKPFCFVLMPFDKQFDDVYQIGIKESCDKGGAYCERVDEQDFHETSLFQRIVNQIDKANFIIADMSEKNPNVFYEVGYAHALGKSTVLLTDNSGDIPFDLKHFPHLVYDRNKLATLREKLTRKVKWFVENPDEEHQKSNVDLNLFFGTNDLSITNPYLDYFLDCKESDGFVINSLITIHNSGTKVLKSEDYRLNIISNNMLPGDLDGYHITQLPSKHVQLSPKNTPSLFPGEYQSIRLTLAPAAFEGIPMPKVGDQDELLFTILTPYGSKDFNLKLRIAAD